MKVKNYFLVYIFFICIFKIGGFSFPFFQIVSSNGPVHGSRSLLFELCAESLIEAIYELYSIHICVGYMNLTSLYEHHILRTTKVKQVVRIYSAYKSSVSGQLCCI